MSPAISTGYVKSPAETNSRRSAFSLNCVIRPSWPYEVTAESSQLASACAVTWLCANTVDRSGSSPVAMSIANRSSVRSWRSRGSWSTVIECRSTMQKNASPCSCVCGVLAEAADVVAEVLVARRLDAREDPHVESFRSLRGRKELEALRPPGRVAAHQAPEQEWRSRPGIASFLAVLARSVKTARDYTRSHGRDRALDAVLVALAARAAAARVARPGRASRPFASASASCRRSSSPARRGRSGARSARRSRAARSCSRPATAPSRSATSPRSRSASGSRCSCRCPPC